MNAQQHVDFAPTVRRPGLALASVNSESESKSVLQVEAPPGCESFSNIYQFSCVFFIVSVALGALIY